MTKENLTKPSKPTSDFPLFAHNNGSWAKKIKGKIKYFGPWNNPTGALERYQQSVLGVPAPVKTNQKPERPAGCPLFPHGNGSWAKKVRGKVYYFGPWRNLQAALEQWHQSKESILASRDFEIRREPSVRDLINLFLNSRQRRVKSGELVQRTVDDYHTVGKVIARLLGNRVISGLVPKDFERLRSTFASTHGPVALTADITRARVIFNYASDYLGVTIKFGDSFDKPTKKVLRLERNNSTPKFFEAEEIRQMLGKANPTLRAMILLGINCAFGNDDCATLEFESLDLETGWHSYARPKTGMTRRSPLWPETVQAIKEAIVRRRPPKTPDLANRVFLTANGTTWQRIGSSNPLNGSMTKLLKILGIHKSGRGFYSLRHTFQTVGDSSGQLVAVKSIVGHVPDSNNMSAVYRTHTFDQNLLAATNFVRDWLFRQTQSSLAPATIYEGGDVSPASLSWSRAAVAETLQAKPESPDTVVALQKRRRPR